MMRCADRPAWVLALALGCGDAGGDDAANTEGTTGAGAPTDPAAPTSGDMEGGTTEAPPPLGPCEQGHPGDQVVRRLSNAEFNATIADLFAAPVVLGPASSLGYEGDANGFTNDVALLTVSWQHVQTYLTATEAIAGDVLAALPQTLACAGAAGVDPIADRACAGAFVDLYGLRMYRRPLTGEEREDLLATYDEAIDGGEAFAEGMTRLIMHALQSPAFLYRLEFGAGALDAAAERMTGYETASRLSYLLWGSLPDEVLFAAAAADELATPEQVAAQVDRMLQDERARRRIRQLHREWLHLGAVNEVLRDGGLFPGFDGLKQLLVEQAERFGEHVVFDDEDGDLRALLTASEAPLTAELAPLYGVDAASAGLVAGEFALIELDPGQRAGMFTQAGVLAALAKPTAPAPVLRGKYVLEKLLCFTPPPPPPDVVMQPPDPALGDTTRERWAALTEAEGSTCAACHATINGPGHAFGHYSAIGGWMIDEGGFPIDAAAGFVGLPVQGEFTDAVEMMDLLAASPAVQACVLRQYFRFAYGRAPAGAQDMCTLDELTQRFAASEADFRDLLVGLTQTDAFRYRPKGGE